MATKLTELQRAERRLGVLRERESDLSDRIARSQIGEDLAAIQLLIQRQQERIAGLRQEAAAKEPTLREALAEVGKLLPPGDAEQAIAEMQQERADDRRAAELLAAEKAAKPEEYDLDRDMPTHLRRA